MCSHAKHARGRTEANTRPDLTIHAADDCDPDVIAELVRSGALQTVTMSRRVKQYLRKRAKVWRKGKLVRVWRPVLQSEPPETSEKQCVRRQVHDCQTRT